MPCKASLRGDLGEMRRGDPGIGDYSVSDLGAFERQELR